MNRKSIVILVAGAMAMLSGCLMFYTGSEEGPFGVVAERDEPGRQKEVILRTAGRANWYVVFGPDGGGKDTYFRATRYYIASGGKTNSLSHATKWAYDNMTIEGAIPVHGTDRWVLAYCTKMTGDFVSLDVRVFTAEKLIARYEIEEVVRDAEKDDLSGYGVCVVSDDGRSITFPTAGGDCVLDGATGKLSRPDPLPDLEEGVRTVKAPKKDGVSLYDCAAGRFAWTIPDSRIQFSRTDTNTFVTCSFEEPRYVFRLRDLSGSEILRREVMCGRYVKPKVSPGFRRVAYFVKRNGGTLGRSDSLDRCDASLCVETFDAGGPSRRNIFDVGVGRELEFTWATDDIIVGTWKKKPNDYDHYDYVVIDAETGKWHLLPFDTNYNRGFKADVSNGRVYLKARDGKPRIYDARTDKIVATLDLANPDWPQDPAGRTWMIGIENGVGVMFARLRTWMLVDWDGNLVKSGPLRRKGIGSIDSTIGHGRFAVWLFDSGDPAVLSTDNRLLLKGCHPVPSPDGYLLIGYQYDPW